MTTETSFANETSRIDPAGALEICLRPNLLLVSTMSSLLRVVQAALRDVARLQEETSEPFMSQPQPVLLFSIASSEDDLTLRFTFADGMFSRPMSDLSERVFRRFMNRYIQFLKKLPQPGFWKDSVSGGQQESYASEIERRMDQLRLEMRRFTWVRIGFQEHSILVEGARMEID